MPFLVSLHFDGALFSPNPLLYHSFYRLQPALQDCHCDDSYHGRPQFQCVWQNVFYVLKIDGRYREVESVMCRRAHFSIISSMPELSLIFHLTS